MTTTPKIAREMPYPYAEKMRGDACLYRLDPPLEYEDYSPEPDAEGRYPILHTEYVVVSAAYVPHSGPETYIFAADGDGKIKHWGELPGSFRGALDHERAIRNAGYEIFEQD